MVDAEGPAASCQRVAAPAEHSLDDGPRIGLQVEAPIGDVQVTPLPAGTSEMVQSAASVLSATA